MIFVVNACAEHIDSQIIFYTFLSLFWAIGIWVISFAKFSKKVTIICWTLFLLYLFSTDFLPSVDMALEHDSCLDSGGRWDSVHHRCER